MSFQVSNEQKKKDKENAKNDVVNNGAVVSKPITQDEEFCAELVDGIMDFTQFKDKQFIVAVSTGDRNKCKLLSSTIRGPYNFSLMVERVGKMWQDNTHHAKVVVLEDDPTKPTIFLDSGTIDYIEANWEDIAFYEALEISLEGENKIIPAGGFIAESTGSES